jgi:hypothetical protein
VNLTIKNLFLDLYSEIVVRSTGIDSITTGRDTSSGKPSEMTLSSQGVPLKVQIENANALLVSFERRRPLKETQPSAKLEFFYDEV